MKDKIQSAKNDDLTKSAKSFVEGISAVEQELYQVKNQSAQDPLNFPIKLNNRFASLRRSVENGDARPTDGAYKVFEELKLELTELLQQLKTLEQDHLPSINKVFEKVGMDQIE